MSPPDLIKAIRSGALSEVIAALDNGAPVEMNDGRGNPGLPLAMACFFGHPEIVRELILRGAKANFPDNRDPTSPLSMAIRAGKPARMAMIELGAELLPGMETTLSSDDIQQALLKAQQFGFRSASNVTVNTSFPDIEEIQITGCYGTDTGVLDAEMRQAIHELTKK